MRDYRKLEIWRRAHLLTVQVYRHTSGFPPDERFNLTSQMRRCAASVPMNIAEGSGRATRADYAHFLSIVGGSLNELEYQLELSTDLGLGDLIEAAAMGREVAEIRAMVTALRSKVSPPRTADS